MTSQQRIADLQTLETEALMQLRLLEETMRQTLTPLPEHTAQHARWAQLLAEYRREQLTLAGMEVVGRPDVGSQISSLQRAISLLVTEIAELNDRWDNWHARDQLDRIARQRQLDFRFTALTGGIVVALIVSLIIATRKTRGASA